jgi:hypothetical protein
MNSRRNVGALLACAGAFGFGGAAMGVTVNLLTAGSQGTVNGAIFQTSDIQPAGTGVIQSFLRMQNNGTEQGYNTSNRPVQFNELTDPNFTRDVRISDLPIINFNAINYYSILLDSNEPQGGTNELVSLDQLKIFTGPKVLTNPANPANLGTLRYDLDAGADSVVRINSTNPGSGVADARILIPVSFFNGTSPTDFFYLFARFGDTDATGDGFEEFALQGGGSTIIPLPSTVGLAAGGLIALGARRRRR